MKQLTFIFCLLLTSLWSCVAQTPTYHSNGARLKYGVILMPTTDSSKMETNGGIYYNSTSNKFRFRQNGAWVSLGSGSAVWGGITGTLSNQTDLQTALDGKWPLSGDGDVGTSTTYIHASDGFLSESSIQFENGILYLISKSGSDSSYIFMDGNGVGFLTNNFATHPFREASDYTANYTARSYTAKSYVDSNLGGNPISSIAQAPTASENGKVLSWYNTAAEWDTLTINASTDFIPLEGNPLLTDQLVIDVPDNNQFAINNSSGTGAYDFTTIGSNRTTFTFVMDSVGSNVRFRIAVDSTIFQDNRTVKRGIQYSTAGTYATTDKSLTDRLTVANMINDSLTGFSGGGISSLVEDTSPQLGGALDFNGQTIGTAAITDTEVGYLNDLTGNIQDQLDDLGGTFFGTGTGSGSGSYDISIETIPDNTVSMIEVHAIAMQSGSTNGASYYGVYTYRRTTGNASPISGTDIDQASEDVNFSLSITATNPSSVYLRSSNSTGNTWTTNIWYKVYRIQ